MEFTIIADTLMTPTDNSMVICRSFCILEAYMHKHLGCHEFLNILANNLCEIKRNSDYRYSNGAIADEERVAWIKAVKLWAGMPDIQK